MTLYIIHYTFYIGLSSIKLTEAPGFQNIAKKNGRILIDDLLRVQWKTNTTNDNTVFGIGDACCDVNLPLPQIAQAAQQQGKYLANNFNSNTFNKPLVEPLSINKESLEIAERKHSQIAILGVLTLLSSEIFLGEYLFEGKGINLINSFFDNSNIYLRSL